MMLLLNPLTLKCQLRADIAITIQHLFSFLCGLIVAFFIAVFASEFSYQLHVVYVVCMWDSFIHSFIFVYNTKLTDRN